MDKTGWYADIESDEYMYECWVPTIQTTHGVFVLDLGFPEKEWCEEFIEDELLGAGLYDSEKPMFPDDEEPWPGMYPP